MTWECLAWYECHWSHGWTVGLAANAILLLAYIGIAYHIFHRVRRTRQWGENPLARGAAALFFTCSIGHGIVALHLLLPTWGIEVGSGMALRHAFNEWHMFLWPPLTAAAGAAYWLMRVRSPSLMSGAGLFEDLQQRRQRAMIIHDDIVQGIAAAKMALDRDDEDVAQAELERVLDRSQDVTSDLLGAEDEGMPVRPGDLRRETTTSDAR